MDNRQKLGWPFWFAVGMMALPVLYVASFGPACWISSRIGDRGSDSVAVVEWAYQPLLRAAIGENEGPRDALHWYSECGAARRWRVTGACFSNDAFWDDR